ncbi:MAG: aminotransferase class III-fold pyridoxal phosphate-dependent enzyme, partial [Hyphomicrobiaceae bacterium]|nr:aminotransferase class III-fold pyridoxal phosphate-dependent enzyme [Hyphomicrobiaceae bacterium]
VPDSAGIPASVRAEMLVAPYNDIEAVEGLVGQHRGEIAAIIVEPFQRIVPPAPGFLEALRRITSEAGIVLIFDEVVTGFRLAYGGAQALYGVTPDLTTLGKAIGGGFPLAAVGGRADIMAHFDKAAVGDDAFVVQIGTLSGNPVAAAAGIATLEILRRPGTYERLFATGHRMMEALSETLSRAGIAATVVGVPPLFDVVFASGPVRDYRGTFRSDARGSRALNAALLKRGILKSDSKYYLSIAHGDGEMETTIAAWEDAMPEVKAALA